MRLIRLLAAALLLAPFAAQAQSIRVVDPSTGQPVFSSANPAPVKSTSTGASADQIQGNVASGAADSGNPVKIGGVAGSSAPSAVTAGQRANQWLGLNGGTVLQAPSATSTAVSAEFVYLPDMTGQGRPLAGLSFVYNGATLDMQKGDANVTAVGPAPTANHWNYASTTAGIVNTTTAVTIKAAGGAAVRNYLCSLQVSHDTLGAVTNLAVRDGAGGTTLWLGRLQTAATDASGGAGTISFNPCLRGTANTLLEVVTLTAVTGAVFVSGQGFTGS